MMRMNEYNNEKITRFPIISCSRRTDIPAFLMDWLLERIQSGFVDVVNPFNKNQISKVSLNPIDVKCWVFWSKNFKEFIQYYITYKNLFNSYKGYFFQFTINSPSELESNILVSLEERFNQMKWLIDEFGLITVNFRFDPIIIYRDMHSNKIMSNLDKFNYIIENVSQLGVKEMIFSFATLYPKVRKRMISRGKVPIDLSFEKKKEIVERLRKICSKYGINMKACCQPDLLKIKGIEQAHCIDTYKIEKIIGEALPKIRDKGQRDGCGCFKSKDIGGYTGIFRCKNNCDYCYASPAKR